MQFQKKAHNYFNTNACATAKTQGCFNQFWLQFKSI